MIFGKKYIKTNFNLHYLFDKKNNENIIIHAIGCFHGTLPYLPGGDVLVITGDITAHDTIEEYIIFNSWLNLQEYDMKIVVYGNHDKLAADDYENKTKSKFPRPEGKNIKVLINESCEYKGITFWGSPNTLWFQSVNPVCNAFMLKESGLNKIYKKIPEDTDVIISHGPMFGVLNTNYHNQNCGSISLLNAVNKVKPKLLIHSHIHESFGHCLYKYQCSNKNDTKVYNVSIMDETYYPTRKYTEISLEKE